MLGACSKENNVADEVSALLEVSINIQEVVIEAAVTQGQEKVEGANEVKFEVKKAGQDTSEEMIGEHQGKGVYSITTTFKRWGPIR
ncbi:MULTISPECIES: FixH family protein [Cytobacillus]|uniref:FixH family protein n=1 Tax=Cytobacillus oceanisediminis TaxID=665099 RepID=UPI001E2EE0D2|nr:FixH family protein [Cytobacillus oceanisediminis]